MLLGAACAGTQDVHAAVGTLLQQHLADTWRSGSGWPKVQNFRVFAVTAATAGRPTDAGQAAAKPAAAVAAGGGPNSDVSQYDANRQGAFGTTGAGAGSTDSSSSSTGNDGSNSSGEQQVTTCSKGSTNSSQQPQEAPVQEVWAELWVKGLPAAACKAAAQQVASHQVSSSTPPGLDDSSPLQRASAGGVETDPGPQSASTRASAAAATAGSGVRVPLQQQAASSWLPQRQKDVAELLLRHGLAHLADPEDCDWLGIRQARWKAYQR